VKRPYARRCGASAPDSDARKGWHYCYVEAGHEGMHEDDARMWQDDDTVEVRTVEEIATVPDHEHDFPQLGQDGDATCSMDPECMLTWNEHMKQQAWWAKEQADICSYCGHAEGAHTEPVPEEGARAYCTECGGHDEFHAMDEEPKRVEATREQLLEGLRAILGPELSQERLEAAVDHLEVMLAQADPEAAMSPQESPQARLDVMRARVEGVRPQGVVVDEVTYVDTGLSYPDPDEDLAVECECGTVWPDGVLGKGHNDMACEVEPEIPQAPQNDIGDDVCFCGCTRKEHRSSLEWGESCDGCTRKGPRATYQWRHPFLLRGSV
jgi:hypothetical protein